jgi:hypothetical protein
MANSFIPELWGSALIKAYQEALNIHKPRRSRGTQLLRDAALGYPEYPDTMTGTTTNAPHRTATEVRLRNEWADAAALALAHAIDRDTLNQLRIKKR